MFDLDDFDAAIAELDARYLAGEAAAHAQTWSLIAGGLRRAQPARTPRADAGLREYRPSTRSMAFAPGDMTAFVHDLIEDSPDINIYIEAVHRLSDLGAVVTQSAHGISQDGLRCRVAGDRHLHGRRRPDQPLRDIRRGRPRRRDREVRATQPTGAATGKRGEPSGRALLRMHFAARDWDAMAKVLADDISIDDRRRVVNAGIRHGRDAEIANMRAIADVGIHEHDVDRHRDPRGAPRPRRAHVRATTELPEAFHTMSSASSRSTPTSGSRRSSCSTSTTSTPPIDGTRCPIPRRRSGRPRAHMVGHRAVLRRAQPARAAADDAGLGEHRPPAGRSVRAR